jgi:hypothetical protein
MSRNQKFLENWTGAARPHSRRKLFWRHFLNDEGFEACRGHFPDCIKQNLLLSECR